MTAVRRFFLLLLLPGWALAAETTYPLEHIETDATDLPSLQRGAALFVNYCQGCHTLAYQRHNRTAADLGIPEDVYAENLIFDDTAIGFHMTNAMPADGAKAWFGAPPPDLTMVTRVRSPDWVYTYLKTFYLDPSRPFGVNNEVLPNAGMPHALIELQGVPEKVCAESGGERRDPLQPAKSVSRDDCIVVQDGTGLLDADAYAAAVYDLVNFLDYVAEPYKADRQRIGVYVLLFLVILYVFAYLLAREYRKEVH